MRYHLHTSTLVEEKLPLLYLEVCPTFCQHQIQPTIYHSNFLIWIRLHIICTSRFGSAPDFLLPPSTTVSKIYYETYSLYVLRILNLPPRVILSFQLILYIILGYIIYYNFL